MTVDKAVVYTVEEAKENGIVSVPWRAADNGGVFVEDDFGNVGWLKSIKQYSRLDGKETTLKYNFPGGIFFYHPNRPTKKLSLGALLSTKVEKGKLYTSALKADKLRALAYVYARTWDKDAAVDIVSGPQTRHGRTRWRKMFKTEEFRTVLREEIDSLLDETGFSKKETMELLRRILTLAEGQEDLKHMLAIFDDLKDMHGLVEKNVVKTTAMLTGTQTMRLVDRVAAEERELKMQITEEATGVDGTDSD